MTYELATTVRRPRIGLIWGAVVLYGLLALAPLASAVAHVGSGLVNVWVWWTAGPLIAAIQRRPRIERAKVVASAEGLRVGAKLYPRARLRSALMRAERDRSWVSLRGRTFGAHVDVAVQNDEEADALTSALGLDAKSTTAEFSLVREQGQSFAPLVALLVLVAMGAGMMIGLLRVHSALAAAVIPLVLLVMFIALVPLMILSRRIKLQVGADGLLVREGFGRKIFYPHDSITAVRAVDRTVTIDRQHGEPLRFSVGQAQDRRRNVQTVEEQRQQARSIAWRIDKGREAFRALAGAAPQAALVLDRGEKSTKDWIDALRRVGEGDGQTFRNVLPTREQLLEVVESTTAAARERLAAIVALRGKLTADEKPRVRVAAERCVAPELRERMVRVLDAPNDEEVAVVLEQAAELEAAAPSSR